MMADRVSTARAMATSILLNSSADRVRHQDNGWGNEILGTFFQVRLVDRILLPEEDGSPEFRFEELAQAF